MSTNSDRASTEWRELSEQDETLLGAIRAFLAQAHPSAEQIDGAVRAVRNLEHAIQLRGGQT